MPTRLLLVLAALALAPAARAADAPVAVVGGDPISREQLEKHVKPQLLEVENQRYEVLSTGLDDLVASKLFEKEAKARNKTVDQLLAEEVAAKVPAPSDADVQKVYDDNKAQLGGQTLEQTKPRIVEFLKEQKEGERREAFVKELRAKYPTTISLKAPVVEVATAGRPERGGGEKAPITIVMFSDYECPYCSRAESTVAEVAKAYGDKVRLVFRNYPLPFHANARPAAEAALCANAQGKFWQFHDKLFAQQANLNAETYKKIAGEVGLDQAKFEQCVAKNEFRAAIDQDVADASAVGVSGTPAFFINGRMLSGAQPFDKFKEIIDQELAAKAS